MSETQLEEQQRVFDDLQGDVGCSKDRINELQQDLETVTSELGDARVDKHEDTRRKKKQEIVENFKRVYPGVYDRLINMSQPIHKKYNVAITKQLGRYMEAIVVDQGTKIPNLFHIPSLKFLKVVTSQTQSYLF